VTRGAVFLDRDGTLIRDVHYVGKPEDVSLIPGAALAVRRLNDTGWLVVVVTNQSGIARGYFTEADYQRVRLRTEELLASGGARIDATYMCPHHPDFPPPAQCECRKPGTLLFRRAAEDLGLDLAASWFVGDKLRDVQPSRELGGRGILVPDVETPAAEIETARRDFMVARTLDEAASCIVESTAG
jgi:histidinol-phosphate phosphatase family protein